jgi:hypothetical protein
MELEVYKKSDFYEDYISSQKEYYERENADAYFAEKLAEKDKEIALLKERIFNGDVSRATWIDDCFDKDKEIAELKAKLENVQASMYADVVDANMENHRLHRALWIARAKRAIEKIAWFKLWNASISTMNPEDGTRQEFDKWKKNLGKFLKKAEEYRG